MRPSRKTSQIKVVNASIFEIFWGPSISSLTFLFEKINIKAGLLKKVLDDLIVSLCKFRINSAGGPISPLLHPKSHEAALCLFNIIKGYVNEIRES